MSKEITVYSTEHRSSLVGSIKLPNETKSIPVPVYVVIVDDNSGSMGGARANLCVEKTKTIITECVKQGVDYRYATFGSRNIQRGKIASSDVKLDCSEGTMLTLLAQAALEATNHLIESFASDKIFRMLYVLNTDGEASDGQAAANEFILGYETLQKRFPSMIEARTFVLGIGANHDQKVLGGMSVGEASYFNYPDDNLSAMVTDSMTRIYPELTSARKPIEIILDVTGPLTVYEENNEIDLTDIRISRHDTTLRVSHRLGTTEGKGQEEKVEEEAIYQLIHHEITTQDSSYFSFCMKGIEEDCMSLARNIKRFFEMKQKQEISHEQILATELPLLQTRYEQLLSQLNGIVDPTADESFITSALTKREEMPNSGDKTNFKQLMKTRQQIYQIVRQQMKARRNDVTDLKAATRAVLTLCETGLHSLRLGSLSTEIERDYMEVLGSGGFKHWTDKKKSRVMNRALEQVDPESLTKVDTKVASILLKYSSELTANEDTSGQKRSVEDDEEDEEGDEFFQKSLTRSCWLTLMRDVDLSREGDVLCLVGYIPPGARNLGLCSVSSSKVLQNAILNGKIEICPHPMSFLTFRQLVLEGQSISRGPNGHPINVCVSFLPIQSSPLSRELAFCYTPICASQLLTSRWIYTVGTGEYRNGVLTALMSLISSPHLNEIHLKTLMTAIDGFCTTLQGSGFFNDLLTRAQNFSQGNSTSGDVPTFLLALGDQFALLWGYKHGSQVQDKSLDISSFSTSKYWQTLFLRLLRDRVDSLFTAYCSPNDPDGDQKRKQKEMDAEETVELLVQGFYLPGTDTGSCDPYRLQTQFPNFDRWENFFHEIGSLSIASGGEQKKETEKDALELDSIAMSLTTLDQGVDLCAFFEEESLDQLTSTAPSSRSQVLDTSSASTSATVTLSATALPLPSSIEDMITTSLQLKRKLPSRGHPSTVLSDEEILSPHSASSPGSVSIDSYRKLFLYQIFKSLQRELQFLVKASAHMMYQLSEGQYSLGDDLNSSGTLFDLLGIERDENGFQWLIAQIILAIKLRTNSRYRTELEKSETDMTTNDTTVEVTAAEPSPDVVDAAATADTVPVQESSILKLTPVQLLSRYNAQYTRKQLQLYQELELIRRQNLKLRYQRCYLTHPGNRISGPLRIFSEDHLNKINTWMSQHRGFNIVRTKCPSDGTFTSMANNTDLTPHSRTFMTLCNPYHVCSVTYGSAIQRQHSPYYEHLHTFSKRTIDTIHRQSEFQSQSDWTIAPILLVDEEFLEFYRLFQEHYMNHTKEDNDYLLVMIWISFSLDRAIEQQKNLFEFGNELFTHLERCLLTHLTMPELVVQQLNLRSRINTEVMWHSDPVTYLEGYFTTESFQERLRLKPSLEEYLEKISQLPHEGGEEELDLQLATEVYHAQYGLDMEEAKKIGLIE